MDEIELTSGEQELTETVGEPEPVQAEGFNVDAYVGDFFYVCIAIGAILPVAGLIIASIVRSALMVTGLQREIEGR